MPTVGLSMIVKDREKKIGRAPDSVAPYVDELLVVDTGSSDGTVQVAKDRGARVEHFPWCDDFAAARNAALDFGTCDWAFVLDSDETLEVNDGPRLRQLPERGLPPGRHAWMFFQRGAPILRFQPSGVMKGEQRLFPRCPQIRYEGVVYECLRYMPNPSRTMYEWPDPPMTIWHSGYDSNFTGPGGTKGPVHKAQRATKRFWRRLWRGTRTNAPTIARVIQFCTQVGEKENWRLASRLAKRFLTIADSRMNDWIPWVYMCWILAAHQLNDLDELMEARDRAETDGAHTFISRYLLASWECKQLPQERSGESAIWRNVRLAEARFRLPVAIEQLELGLSQPQRSPVPSNALHPEDWREYRQEMKDHLAGLRERLAMANAREFELKPV